MYFENGQEIRLRVTELDFSRVKPILTQTNDDEIGNQINIPSHFIIGSCNEECLGMSKWW